MKERDALLLQIDELKRALADEKDVSEARKKMSEALAHFNDQKTEELEKLSKGLYDRCKQGSPFIETSSVDTALAELDNANRLNGELRARVEMLTASLESILKRELGLDFQTYLKAKEAGPLHRVLLDELIAKIQDKTEKRKCPRTTGTNNNVHCVKDAGHESMWCEDSTGLIRWRD